MRRLLASILLVIMVTIANVAIADLPAILFYESFDEQPGRNSIKPQFGKAGIISGKYNSIDGKFGKAMYLPAGSSLKFPAKFDYNPAAGTIEFWISRQADLPVRNQYTIFSVDYGSDARMKLYSRDGTRPTFVFWALDGNDKAANSQEGNYRYILPSGRLNFKKGKWHHIAVTWSKDSQHIYLDGRMIRHMYFDGELKVKPGAIGQLIIAGDGGYAIDEFRIWDSPRSPRKLSSKPSPKDADINYPANTRKLSDTSGMKKISADDMAVYFAKGDAEFLVDTANKTQWLHRPVKLLAEIDGNVIDAKLNWGVEAGKLYCKTVIADQTKQPTDYQITLTAPILKQGLTCFIATDDSPFPLEQGRKFYDHEPGAKYKYGVSLPIASVYDKGSNVGLSIINPDSMRGSVSYDFGGDDRPEDLRIVHKGRVFPGESLELKWYFVTHQADWRGALAKYVEINPAIMTPPRGPAAKGDQGMVIGGPSTEEFILPLRKLGVGWREVSLCLGKGAGFGNYIPDDLGPYMNAVKGYRRDINVMHKYGLLAMMYIQARECKNVQRALSEFKESVVFKNGKPEIDRCGPFGVSMTARPGSGWFVHLEDQARRILKTFPNCDGFFFDNAWSTDFADIMNAVAKIAHDSGRSLVSNGANWASVGSSDSIMAESAWYCLGDMQYLGLAKPVHYVPIYSYNAPLKMKEKALAAPGIYKNLMRDIKECLKAGASYGFNYRGIRYWPEESIKLMEKYVVFQRLLAGRKWILRPHVLELPQGISGNIFELADGRWMITLVNDDAEKIQPGGAVRVRLPENAKLVSFEFSRLEAPEKKEILKQVLSDDAVEFSVKALKNAAVVLIEYK